MYIFKFPPLKLRNFFVIPLLAIDSKMIVCMCINVLKLDHFQFTFIRNNKKQKKTYRRV